MHVPFPFRPHRLGAGIGFLFLLTVLAASTPPPAAAATSAQEDSQPVYLPMLMQAFNPPPPPTAFEQIDLDLDAGRIDSETALIYKTFAEFGDPRLPAAYTSSDIGGEAGLFMLELVEAFPGLSSATQDLLAPFFIPPYQAGSWLSQTGRTQAGAAPSDWAYITAAGGKARVWYKKADPGFQYKAQVVAGALNDIVWQKETDLMGREPILDEAGVQNFVVFDKYRNGWNSTFVPWGDYAGMAVPQKCAPSASVIYINPAVPDTGNNSRIGIVETTAHEFMHALQFSFTLKGSAYKSACTEYLWMGEATATWAEDYVYHDHNTEWSTAQQ